jgi:hypothetical protein
MYRLNRPRCKLLILILAYLLKRCYPAECKKQNRHMPIPHPVTGTAIIFVIFLAVRLSPNRQGYQEKAY